MTKKQQLLIDLRDIEIDTIKKEKNFDFRTALIKIFKAIYRLFKSEQDVSKKDIVNTAERESKRLGLEGQYNWNEILGLKEVDQDVKQQVTFSNGNSYPDNFYVGKAIVDGSCFFDSFRQGLEQQKGIKVTVEQLRMNCLEFAFDNANKEGWFKSAIAHSYDDNNSRRHETPNSYATNILNNNRWGDPDVEGRILCEKYDVKLHVIENQTVDNQDLPLHQLIDDSGSKNAGEYNKVNYDDSNVLHVINKGYAHFEPLLDINKSLAKQEQEDFLLAKKLQIDEILEYCNLSKDISERAEVEKRFDELLAKNADGKIGDVVGQCVSDIKQSIERSEEQNPSSLPRCGMEETRIEAFHQQPQLVK